MAAGPASIRPFDPDRVGDQIRLSLMWFAGNALWEALLTVVLPILVLRAVGDARKAVALSVLATVGTLLASVVHPLAGWASDATRSGFGRRRPYVLGGAVVAAVAMLWMAFGTGYTQLVASVLLLQLGYNTATAGYQAYIPEIAPEGGRGKASGFLGLMSSLGALVGAIGSRFLIHGTLYRDLLGVLVALLLLGAVVTVWGLPEAPSPQRGAPQSALPPQPGRYRDFIWVVATRALVMLAFYTLLTYLLYYLKDVAGLPNYTSVTSYVVAVTILAASACTVWAGTRSDSIGRRPLVCAAGILMGAAAAAFLLVRGVVPILLVGVVFGLGYGAYQSVDWALATDVLPDSGGIARDMGLWGLGTTVPQMVAPLIAGTVFLLVPVGPAAYRLIFGLTALYAFVGSALVWQIRGVR